MNEGDNVAADGSIVSYETTPWQHNVTVFDKVVRKDLPHDSSLEKAPCF